jgi:hypothetical protein
MAACGCVHSRMSATGEPPAPESSSAGPLVVFIARRAEESLISRVTALIAAGVDAHIIADEVESLPAVLPRNAGDDGDEWSKSALRRCAARVHSVDATEVRRLKWTNMTAKFLKSGRDVTGWEKATLWAHGMLRADAAAPEVGAGNETAQRCVWLIEDDVWWAENGLVDMMSAYSSSSAHLIAQKLHPTYESGPSWPHWALGSGVLPNKFFSSSFNVICRVSFRVLEAAAALARARGRLAFHEVLFASLVRMLAAGVFKPPPPARKPENSPSELSSAAASDSASYADTHAEWFLPPWSSGIRYRPEWTDSELSASLDETDVLVFHPVKHEVRLDGVPPQKRIKI